MQIHRFKIPFNTRNKIYGFTGKVSQGAFLGLLKNEGDMTADVLHFGNLPRPYSVTPIRVKNPCFFEVTSLNNELSSHISQILSDFQNKCITISDCVEPLLPPEIKTIFLHPQPVDVGTTVNMQFLTPTLFSSVHRKAKTDPYPHTHKIWGDLVKVWNLHSSNPIDLSVIEKLQQQLSTPSFHFRSVPIKMGNIKIIGFVGKISFKVENNSDLDYLIPLSKLAGYFGVGGKKSMGFGNVRVRINNGVKKSGNKKNAA